MLAANGAGASSQGDGGADGPLPASLSVDQGKVPDLVVYVLTEDGKDFVPEEGRCQISVSLAWLLPRCVGWVVVVVDQREVE